MGIDDDWFRHVPADKHVTADDYWRRRATNPGAAGTMLDLQHEAAARASLRTALLIAEPIDNAAVIAVLIGTVA